MLMKLNFLFICGFALTLSANSFAQQERVSFDLKDVSVKVLLDEIQKQTNLCFLFNPEQTNRLGKVSLQVENETVKNVLDRVFEGSDLTYKFRDDLIVIMTRKDEPEDKKKEIRIVGKVTDEQKNVLPGVTVMVEGLKLGTATNAEGRYALVLPEIKDCILVYSFIGMETRKVKYTGKDTIDVVLKEDKQVLEDVVVTGYANVRKESFTGNVTTVTKKQLMQTNNKSVITALQVFDPSFRIKENTLWGSDPNALPEFNIRGESSIAMKKGLDVEMEKQNQRTNLKDNPNLPIFIMDGFEVSVQKIYDMDMNRIESITILKDAAATAMYGSRAANGVVVVTTVAPRPGEIRVTYNFTGGVELPDLSDYNLCNAEEKLEVERLSGVFADNVYGEIAYNKKLRNVLQGIDTDWLAQPLRNVFNHQHSIYLEGGVESVRYGVDLNYDSNNGVMKESRRSRAGAGLSLDFRFKDKVQVRNYISYSSTRTEDSPYGTFSDYANMQPYYAIYDDEGNMHDVLGDDNITNPLWKTTLDSYSGKGYINDLTDNLNINWSITDGLQFKGQFSITKTDSQTESFEDPADPKFRDTDNKEKGTLIKNTTKGYSWNVNAMLYYNKTIQKHFINAVAGVNMKDDYSETTGMTFKGFQLGNMHTPAYAATQPDKSDVSSTESRLIGVLASLNYTYDDIYLLDASFRLDGSSQFGTDKRFAPFWSLGVGLNLHNYKWLKDHYLLSTLRVRGSYGSTGKVNFPSYTAIATYQTDSDSWYYTGPVTGLMYLGNPKLTWETTKSLDVGLTVGLLQDQIYLQASYYRKKTEDLIDEIAVRTSSGFDNYYSNAGSVVNKGMEFNLNAMIYRDKDWIVGVTANLAANKNEITSLGKATEEYNRKLKEEYDATYPTYGKEFMTTPFIQYYVGTSTTAIYAVRSAGIDPANGKEKFIKKNGTTTYTWCADDQVVVGDRNPDAQGALGFNVGFRGIYLNASFMYQWGAQIYNSTLLNKVENADIRNSNVDKRVLAERWKWAGDLAPYYDLENRTVTQPTSRFVQNYNYLNFSSLSIGYDFEAEVIRKWRLASLGIRFNANDLCRWTTVKEERGTSYPYAKNYSFTINIGF